MRDEGGRTDRRPLLRWSLAVGGCAGEGARKGGRECVENGEWSDTTARHRPPPSLLFLSTTGGGGEGEIVCKNGGSGEGVVTGEIALFLVSLPGVL